MKYYMLCLLIVSFVPLTHNQSRSEEIDPAKVDFFEKKVRPILVQSCYGCHSADTKPAGGLRVDDRNGLIVGGNSGAAVVPGEPEKSLLLKRVRSEQKRRMPLEGDALTEEQVSTLSTWIKNGAVWPPLRVPSTLGKDRPEYETLRKKHWAFQPLQRPALPEIHDGTWPRDSLDHFVLARLEAAEIRPGGDADRLTLIRRVTFDLTGLPPTPAEVDAFVEDDSKDAFTKVVDRLLASSQFGERWGRHWLDVARYGESTGPSRNIPYPHAWRYRDYVIDQFNQDLPFNRFIQEQIAGDLLPNSGDSQKIATGFLALGVKDVNQRFKTRFLMDNVDEQIDAVSRSFLGLTVSCARCHDHKFDPIPITDYYSLAGIFTSTENAAGVRNQMGGAGLAYYVPEMLVRLSGKSPEPQVVEKLKAELAEAKAAWDAIRGTPEGLKPMANGQPTQRPYRLKFERLQSEFLALTDPAQKGQATHGVRDGKQLGDTEIRLRGEAEKLGPSVPRGYLTAFSVPGASRINPQQSGRKELAEWLSSDQNPLTPRVIVNRVWSHLFSQGLVSTVDNFGINGNPPSHPELLDFLANRFISEGWSVKKLIREIVLSRTYQLSSESTSTHRQKDPANQLLWRHAPRRLEAEELRDAVLHSSGAMLLQRVEGSPTQQLKMVEIRDNGPEAKSLQEFSDRSRSRSVYLPLLRGVVPRSLEAFDPVEQTLVTGSREQTTVPGQALFLLNSSFLRRNSLTIAERVLAEPNRSDRERLIQLYRLILAREPSEAEVKRALRFLSEYESSVREELARIPLQQTVTPSKPKATAKKSDEPPPDPDQVDQTGETFVEENIQAKDSRTAAWLALAQAIFGSAEFRFIR